MNYLMLIGDAFEDVEAIATLDVLLRGGERVTCASMMKKKEIKTKCGNEMFFPTLINDVNMDDFDALIIPGGPGSFKILAFMEEVNEIINHFVKHDKLVCAICAAPMLIGRLGYLNNKSFTCHPGFEDKVIGGKYLREEGVVQDGKFITAKSMFYSIEFGLKIYAYFHGIDESEKLRKACQGE